MTPPWLWQIWPIASTPNTTVILDRAIIWSVASAVNLSPRRERTRGHFSACGAPGGEASSGEKRARALTTGPRVPGRVGQRAAWARAPGNPRQRYRRRATAVSDHLTFTEEPEGLRRPLLIMAFSGWNDAAESATTAARYLSQLWSARTFASIDPEDFYHFGLSRPYVRFKPGSRTEREIIWPATEFSLAQPSGIERDLIVGVAIEPHLKWR